MLLGALRYPPRPNPAPAQPPIPTNARLLRTNDSFPPQPLRVLGALCVESPALPNPRLALGHSLQQERSATPFLSSRCALFTKTPGWHQERFFNSSLATRHSSLATKFRRINTYSQTPRFTVFWPQLSASKSLRFLTYKRPLRKPFGSNTYEKQGRGGHQVCQPSVPIAPFENHDARRSSRNTDHRPRVTSVTSLSNPSLGKLPYRSHRQSG